MPWEPGGALRIPEKSKRKLLTSVFLIAIILLEVNNMTGREIVKDIMNKENKTNAELADRLRISQAAMWERLNNKKVRDIPLSTLSAMLRALDYKVCIVPRGHRIPDDGYVVD
nr:MAG TPA: LAMBDA REPRESSOR (TRIPLE MUTANT)/DNA COMPLEX-DNA COMPLEX, DOUBLE HELIX, TRANSCRIPTION-DNA.1A [Bacteriophage sp.]